MVCVPLLAETAEKRYAKKSFAYRFLGKKRNKGTKATFAFLKGIKILKKGTESVLADSEIPKPANKRRVPYRQSIECLLYGTLLWVKR